MPTSYTPTYASPGTAYAGPYSARGTAYSSPYAPSPDEALLKEDGFYLLLENGGRILIRRGIQYTPTYPAL